MTDKLVFEETVGEDGKLTLQLPPGAPRGHIRITVEAVEPPALSPEEEAALDAEIAELLSDENLQGLGQIAEEIAHAPEIGIWKDRTDITDSVEFVEALRRRRRQARSSRD